jgi:hypothetical protein
MALDRNELSLLIQEYLGHEPRSKHCISYFQMSEQLVDKILKLETDTNILVTDEDKKIFIEAIVNPPKANDKLKEAQRNHSKIFNKKLGDKE